MPHAGSVGLGLMLGLVARLVMLRSDYRQYPTYPHAYTTHLFMGAIAALSGAVTVPALVEGEWTAVTFFLLVAEQFRGIRSMERDSLKALEDDEQVPRGSEYIEDISRVFETRYYVTIFVAASASAGYEFGSAAEGTLFALIAAGIGILLMDRERLGDLVHVSSAPVTIENGRDVYVEDIFIVNLGLEEAKKTVMRHAIGAVLAPKSDVGRDTLANKGQRQALLHDATAILGVRKDGDTPEYSPIAARDLQSGKVGIYFMPMEKDEEALVETIKHAYVLESARGRSRRAGMGRRR